MHTNIDKSGHIKSLVYGLTIGFEPEWLLLSKDMLQAGTTLSS